ncbi:stage V sporulation protein R [Bacillus cereus]|nr:stage V sporulation protein R [Bacillus cereus]
MNKVAVPFLIFHYLFLTLVHALVEHLYACFGGFPYLVVEDGDYLKNGELYIKHSYEGIELDLKYLEKVLPYLHQLWGRTVHMESIVESKGVVFSYDGKMVHRKYV